VEVVVDGAPAGWGDPVFDKLDALLAWAMLSIGAVKGIEFGAGFGFASMRGSESNDQMTSRGFLSNTAGGILGGLSNGQPIVMRLAVKPTASISKPQRTVDIHGNDRLITVEGRHDPCLCPRIGPVAEAMAALVLIDRMPAGEADAIESLVED
jgi:chorismate synthase